MNSICLEVSFIYRLNRVGDKTEPCGNPACISLVVDISPSTGTLNSRFGRKELMSLIKLVENSNLDNSNPQCHMASKRFRCSRTLQP
jgi:hypothetical protein